MCGVLMSGQRDHPADSSSGVADGTEAGARSTLAKVGESKILSSQSESCFSLLKVLVAAAGRCGFRATVRRHYFCYFSGSV